MTNENIRNIYLQYVYLGFSLMSSFCVITNFHIINCSNIVGLMCLGDLYFIKKKDMLIHHIFVLSLLDYMNIHDDIQHKNKIVSTILSTEISTIFLITNNLLDIEGNMLLLKNINQIFFVITFVYYRLYNYSVLMLDKNIYNSFIIFSKNDYEFYKLYSMVYGFYILNIYWFTIIGYRIYEKLYNVVKYNEVNKIK